MIHWSVSSLFCIAFCVFHQDQIVHPVDHGSVTAMATCDLIVDAGPDTNVCYPGGSIGLMGSITGNEVFYQWMPTTGLNNPFILTPTANVSSDITYTLTAWAPDPDNPELIVNGDFSAGNTGFSSDYNYVVDLPNVQNEMFPEGTYSVLNNPNLVHTGFSPCGDHTTGSGNMMVINGAANLQDIWCQTVAVTPGSFYNVSAWVTSVNPASPAQLQFSINGIPIGSIINALPTPCIWIPFNAVWNSGNNTTAEICILNLNTATGGNDFALDDISMIGMCSVSDDVEITLYEEEAPEPEFEGPAFVCEGDIATYLANFPADPPIYTYQWVIPSGAILLNGQGTPQVTVQWNEADDYSLCLQITTRCDMNESCYDVTVGTVPDLPSIFGESSLCPGETAILYTPEQDIDDTYNWILPPNVNMVSGEGTNEIEIEWAAPGDAEICVEVTNACGTTENCTLITLHETYLTLFDTLICAGDVFEINGHTYGNGILSGIEYFLTSAGCDSIVEVDVMEVTSLVYMVDVLLCPGDSIFLEGQFQGLPGIYVDSFQTVNGCDSIILTDVQVTPHDTTWLFATTCDSAMAGIFSTTYAQGNCDSTVIQQIDFIQPDTLLFISASCAPSDTGYTVLHLMNVYGCDSMIITDIRLLASDTTRLFSTSCDPAAIGLDTIQLYNQHGCDSLVIETTAYVLSDTTHLMQWVCQYPDTGTISTLLVNGNGCDSLVVLASVYGGSDTTFLFGSTCFSTDSGWSMQTYVNATGCDSVVSQYAAWIPADTTFIFLNSCASQDTGTVITHLTNTGGCDSMIVQHTSLLPIDVCELNALFSLTLPLCYEDTAWLTIHIQTGTGPFELDLIHLDMVEQFQFPDKGVYVIPVRFPNTSFIIMRSANGLMLEDSIFISWPHEVRIDAKAEGDYHGYGIPCFGDHTGGAFVQIYSGGTPPLNYQWSDGSLTQDIDQLGAGLYEVTVTDANGCSKEDRVEIKSPPPLAYAIQPSPIHCFGGQDGILHVNSISGGVSPWLTSLDGSMFSDKTLYPGLGPGLHDFVILDQNGCSASEQFNLSMPSEWSIDLGPDTIVSYGSTLMVQPHFNGTPQGEIAVKWSDHECPDCLVRNLSPHAPITLEVTVTDSAGCISSDEIKILVHIDRDLFIPNVFSPNGDQINDRLVISAGASVERIDQFSVYDRWGNLVYRAQHFLPNDPAQAWDGRMNGDLLNPGVFTYQLMAVYVDGRREVRFGDVTLVR